MNSFFLILQKWTASNRTLIIRLFQSVYVSIWIWIAASLYTQFFAFEYAVVLAQMAKKAGELAIIIFLLVTLPGILGRFRFKHPLISIGILFRRYMGILVSFLVLFHSFTLYTFPAIEAGTVFAVPPTFIVSAMFANFMLVSLMLTSNNASVQKLGKWWKRLHRLVYVIFWLIFGHLFLQGSYKWGGVIAVFGALEILSLLFDLVMKKRQPVLPQATPKV